MPGVPGQARKVAPGSFSRSYSEFGRETVESVRAIVLPSWAKASASLWSVHADVVVARDMRGAPNAAWLLIGGANSAARGGARSRRV